MQRDASAGAVRRNERNPVGAMIGDHTPPERIGATAKLIEDLGYGEIWIPEDYFYVPAITGVTVALGATSRIPVGAGVVSAVARHPAVVAMEFAALARAFPGRVRPGFGLGFPPTLMQMGVMPKGSLSAMRECVTSVRALLAGREVTLEGKVFTLDQVKLTYPPSEVPPITVGVMGPKMLQLAGQVADAVLVGSSASLEYLAYAREQVGNPNVRYPCLAFTSVDRDGDKARAQIRPVLGFFLAMFGTSIYTDVYGNSDVLADMLERGGVDAVVRGMPDAWIDDLAIVGTPDEAAVKMNGWLRAGADSVVVNPCPAEKGDEMLRLIAEEVFPQITGPALSA